MKCAEQIWISIPLDHVWLRLSYIDEHGGSLLDIQKPTTDPFRHCMQQYGEILARPLDDGPLQDLYLLSGHGFLCITGLGGFSQHSELCLVL